MFKLVVLSVMIACALAGVVPKTPATNKAKDESPAVKSVPLHSSSPNQKSGQKADVKLAEDSKLQEKSVKKDDNKAPLKKSDKPLEEKSMKSSPGRESSVKSEKVVAPSVKEAPKGQPVEITKGKSKAPGRQ